MEQVEQKFTTATPMIKKKIDLNNKYKELYAAQIKGLLLQKEAVEMDIASCKNRISSINSVNIIENLQLDNFDAERQKDINDITNETNEMNIGDSKIKVLISKSLNDVSKKILTILKEAEQIKSQIPETGVAENYKVKINIPVN
jgi:hypothetical protein